MNEKIIHAYIAGIFDGEGHISLKRTSVKKYSLVPYVGITNTNIELLNYIHSIFGGKIITLKIKNAMKHKQAYYLGFRKGEVIKLLNSIKPFLLIKKNQCEIVLNFIKLKKIPKNDFIPNLREQIINERLDMKFNLDSLNKTGPNIT